MIPTDPLFYLAPLVLLTLLTSLVEIKKSQIDLKKKKKELDEKIYETLILNEISQIIGYELDLEKILETIINSLAKVYPYSAVSYLVVSPDQTKASIRFHLEESVNRNFLDDIKKHMLDSLNTILDQKIELTNSSESLTGTNIDEKLSDKVMSLWVVPIAIKGDGLGVLAIASKKSGLYKGSEMDLISKILTNAKKTISNLEMVLSSEEEKRMSAQKELDRVHDEFTAMMVHELRAPLTIVRGTTDMFLRDPNMAISPQGQELMKTMETSSTTMLSLVNDLLDAAKIDAGKFQIIKTPGNLAEIIADRVLFFTQMANQKSIVISTDIPDQNLQMTFDKERMSQVLNNLISNAIKFTDAGGKVTVLAKKDDSKVTVSISDTGIGIPSEKIPELFSKFKQLKPMGDSHPGTGLGLVIAKGIIESHGGQIFVDSRLNEGTTFSFTLPLNPG